MAFEMLIALNVTNDEGYQAYRDAMTPLLEKSGGGFGYDFKVSEVLKASTQEPINRVFTIFFKSEEAKDAFFSNEEYLEIKQKYFEGAVTDVIIISDYVK